MSVDKPKAAGSPATPASDKNSPARAPIPPLFRRIDWLTFALIVVPVFIGYVLTLAPDVTLEDSGELATGSFYAGVPHPPGYPLWTIITWFFTRILPSGNIAHRVALASAVAGALASGLLGLMVSRGSSMLIKGIEAFRGIPRRAENAICLVAGFFSGSLLAFNGYMWSQSVIVEVYPLSVLSFMCVFCCLLRWLYAPGQRRYLYWAWFLFGVCFTNHQTLILAAMGLEVFVIVTQPKIGRDMLLVNSILFLAGLFAIVSGVLGAFAPSQMVTILFCIVGVSSIIGCIWLVFITQGLGTETLSVLILFSLWLAGAAIFFYMPLTSMTNPPMNWGYARTVDGFIHALTRGQYEKTNPTNFFKDPGRLLNQLRMYFEGATDEFNLINLFMALVPLVFFFRMQRRERSWLIGLASVWVCMSFLLMILLNPNPDRASRDLIKVFFTASYTVLAIFSGYGVTLTVAAMLTNYQRFRTWGLIGGSLAVVLAIVAFVKTVFGIYPDSDLGLWNLLTFAVGKAFSPNHYGLPIHAGLLLMGLTAAFVLGLLLSPGKPRFAIVLLLFALMPFHSILSHWSDNEQRGHWFGYWYGHDMFCPPYGLYPQMTRSAVLYGGTDPGRFCPTYMIFCEGFIPPGKRPEQDPSFNRRDVYIITQNALADGTYLEYIRAQYDRSTQTDPPFFQELFRSGEEKSLNFSTNGFANIVGRVLDRPFMKFGAQMEEHRRKEGVYPPAEIYIPSQEQGNTARTDYYSDVARRIQHDREYPNEPKQLKPGEEVQLEAGGKLTVSGQVSVFAINGTLAKIIFDNNPTNEFFVEESYPIDWMYPYLTPFGIILKLNRQPVDQITDEMVRRDHEFWSRYSERLSGNWVTYDTKISDVADFADHVYLQRDYTNFKGDRRFIRDDDAQKSFAKLRGATAGIYDWRFRHARNPSEAARMLKEAEFAYRQSLAFCPYAVETVFRYMQLLLSLGRVDDALLVVQTCLKLDPENEQVKGWEANLVRSRIPVSPVAQPGDIMPDTKRIQAMMNFWETEYRAHPTNFQAAFDLTGAYLQLGQTNKAEQVLDQVVADPRTDASALAFAARFLDQMSDLPRMEIALKKLTDQDTHSPEAWFDLATSQAMQGETNQALASLRRSAEENTGRLARLPGATNIFLNLRTNPHFRSLKDMPEFQKLAPR